MEDLHHQIARRLSLFQKLLAADALLLILPKTSLEVFLLNMLI